MLCLSKKKKVGDFDIGFPFKVLVLFCMNLFQTMDCIVHTLIYIRNTTPATYAISTVYYYIHCVPIELIPFLFCQ